MTHEARRFAIEKTLGVTFRNGLLLMEALTHPSALAEYADHPVRDNQRLEFLGDTVLQMEVTESLWVMFPGVPEGKLTVLRSALVCNATLGRIAMDLHLDAYAYIAMSSRLDMRLYRTARPLMCACLFEAILGALYLDQGHDACKDVIDRHIVRHLKELCDREAEAERAAQEGDGPVTTECAEMRAPDAPVSEPMIPSKSFVPIDYDESLNLQDQECAVPTDDVLRVLSQEVKKHFSQVPTFSVRPTGDGDPPQRLLAECRVCGVLVTRSVADTRKAAVHGAARVALKYLDSWRHDVWLKVGSRDRLM